MKAQRVFEDEVLSVPAPEWTDTWHPVSHRQLIESLETATKDRGLEVIRRSYELSPSGATLFGTWAISPLSGNREVEWQIGFRNAVNRTMALGITAGTRVLVCSNMAFNGQFVAFRRHTKGLTIEVLQIVAGEALDQAVLDASAFEGWLMGLREIRISQEEFRMLTWDLLTRTAYPVRLRDFLQNYEAEEQRDFSGTLFAWYGAVTRSLRNRSIRQTFDITRDVNQLVQRFQNNRLPAPVVIPQWQGDVLPVPAF